MKMKTKLLLSGLLAALCTSSAFAQQWTFTAGSGSNGTIANGAWVLNVTVSGTTNLSITGVKTPVPSTPCVLPLADTVNGGYRIVSVTGIGSTTAVRPILTGVTFPDSLTNIGNSAFSYCSNLTAVTIPDSVISLGNYVFQYCTGLTSVKLSDNLTILGNYAFQYCSSLTDVTLPNNLINMGGGAFRNCTSLTSITFPTGVVDMGSYTFYSCSNLTSVTFPADVVNIGEYAFRECTSLSGALTFPAGVTNIGNYAFSYCPGLTDVTFLNKNAFRINTSAFNTCINLTNVTFYGIYPTVPNLTIYANSPSVVTYVDHTNIGSWNPNVIPANTLESGSAKWCGQPIMPFVPVTVTVVPGKDGATNTVDDVRITPPSGGAVVFSNGYVVVSSGDKVCNSTNGVIYRKDGSTPVPAGSLIASNGTIFVAGSTLNPDGTVTIPTGGSIILYLPPWTELFFPDGGEYNPVTQVVVLPDDKGEVDTNGDHTRTVPQALGIEYDTTPVIDWDNDVFTTNSCTVVSHSIYAKVSLTDTNDWIDITSQISSLYTSTESATVELIDPIQNEEYRFFRKRIRIRSLYQP